jgi:dTDP-4-amino-4,6-dideoxygalactose transaminase
MTNETPYLIFGAPALGDEELDEVIACVRSGWLGTGPRVKRFEADFAAYKNVDASLAAGVNSCTAALHVAMVAAGLEPGAEVITTPMTFCATVNAIIHAGLKPVLADIDPATQCIDPRAVEAAITPRTQAIIPVHFAGRPCDMDAILAIAAKHGLVVIEDCAHAIETEYRGRKAGTFGDFGCFSFYATKNVATGEGGLILARDPERIARARILALHGMSKDAWHRFSDQGYKHYDVVEAGFKYNMMDLQAAIGIHQLAKVERHWQRRLEIWNGYLGDFAGLPIELPAPFELDTRHALHLFTIGVDAARCGLGRDELIMRLHEAGIGTGVHYRSIAEHPHYQTRFGWRAEQWPESLRVGKSTVSLPLSPALDAESQARVVRATLAALGSG